MIKVNLQIELDYIVEHDPSLLVNVVVLDPDLFFLFERGLHLLLICCQSFYLDHQVGDLLKALAE